VEDQNHLILVQYAIQSNPIQSNIPAAYPKKREANRIQEILTFYRSIIPLHVDPNYCIQKDKLTPACTIMVIRQQWSYE